MSTRPSMIRRCRCSSRGPKAARQGLVEFTGRRVPVRRRSGRHPQPHLVHRPPGRDHRDRGQHGEWQVHADRAHPSPERRDCGQHPDRRARHPGDEPGGSLAPHRVRPPEGFSLLRDGGQQSALRQPGRHRRGTVARAAGRAGGGLRLRHVRGTVRADHPGGHERLRRTATAACHRPGDRQEARHLRL